MQLFELIAVGKSVKETSNNNLSEDLLNDESDTNLLDSDEDHYDTDKTSLGVHSVAQLLIG